MNREMSINIRRSVYDCLDACERWANRRMAKNWHIAPARFFFNHLGNFFWYMMCSFPGSRERGLRDKITV